ncbi:hypothetical protein DXG01_002151 [Tephrocybe rancida]|nr:hypothetical protein DXG01_002151 [Tephrocybe rancida]
MSDLHPKLKLRPDHTYHVVQCLDSLALNRDYQNLRAVSISFYKHKSLSQHEFLLLMVLDRSSRETFHLLIERGPGKAQEDAPRRSVVRNPADISVGSPIGVVVNAPAPAINSPQFAGAGVNASSKLATSHDKRLTPIPLLHPPEASTSAFVDFTDAGSDANPTSRGSGTQQIPASPSFPSLTSFRQLSPGSRRVRSQIKDCVAVDTVEWILGQPKKGEGFIQIGTLTFPTDPASTPIYLCDIINLALVVHDAHPTYSLLDKNCYFYAGTLVELLERICNIDFVVSANTPPSSQARGVVQRSTYLPQEHQRV